MILSASLFSQLLKHFPKTEFVSLAKKHGVERYSKGFASWSQFVAMLFCQLAKATSLREICNGLSCCLGKLTHLGVKKSPNKSTLSYANKNRSSNFFQDLFWTSLHRFRGQGNLNCRKAKFRFKNKLLSLDSSTISLCLSLFPWAKYRRAKGGVKLHVLLDHDDYLPQYIYLSEAKQHDVKAARLLNLLAGSIVVMDRGYTDYQLFSEWCEAGVFFVTRLKENADFTVIEKRACLLSRNITSDELIRLKGMPQVLRRISFWDEAHQRTLVFLTNHLEFAATTIAAIYKERWEIELFFKSLKQNLKVKSFIGTSENALRVQIWTALIAMLLLKWLHHLSKAGWSFSNLAAMLRMNLFTYRDLEAWLNHPLDTKPVVPEIAQVEMNF